MTRRKHVKSDLGVFRDNLGTLRGIITDDKEILCFVQKTIPSHSLQSERIYLEILRNLLQNFSKSSTAIRILHCDRWFCVQLLPPLNQNRGERRLCRAAC